VVAALANTTNLYSSYFAPPIFPDFDTRRLRVVKVDPTHGTPNGQSFKIYFRKFKTQSFLRIVVVLRGLSVFAGEEVKVERDDALLYGRNRQPHPSQPSDSALDPLSRSLSSIRRFRATLNFFRSSPVRLR